MLRGRLNVLRAVLADLPRYGLRLLRRVMGPRSTRAARDGARPSVLLDPRFSVWGLVAARIERPPDKAVGVLITALGELSLPPVAGRGAFEVGLAFA